MKKMNHNLYVVFLSVVMLMVLTACNDGNSSNQNHLDENTMSQAVTDQQQNEGEIEVKPGADTLQTEPTMPIETQPTSGQLLVGEWYEGITKNEFRSDGTGVIENLGSVYEFTWSIDDNTLTSVWSQSTTENRFEFVDNELHLTDNDGIRILTREPSSDYVQANQEFFQYEVQETTLKQNFLGEWYFDVFIWRFNDDGTGVIDIPKFGKNPAEEKGFDYEIVDNQMGDNYLSISLPDGKTVMYLATYGNQSGGSVTLQPMGGGESIMLTRSYDVRNSPITDEIIEEGIALFEALTSFSGMGEMILEEIVK